MVLISLLGCGKKIITTQSQDTVSESSLSTEGNWIEVKINVPPANWTGPRSIDYMEKNYKIGSLTPASIQTYINNLPVGSVNTKDIKGSFAVEKGQDVFQVQEIR